MHRRKEWPTAVRAKPYQGVSVALLPSGSHVPRLRLAITTHIEIFSPAKMAVDVENSQYFQERQKQGSLIVRGAFPTPESSAGVLTPI
jgi:hypothetical protein